MLARILACSYLVGTPIGNLEDISFRALRVLRSATLVLAEDTRHSRKLLSHYGINASMLSFHEHNEVCMSLGDNLHHIPIHHCLQGVQHSVYNQTRWAPAECRNPTRACSAGSRVPTEV